MAKNVRKLEIKSCQNNIGRDAELFDISTYLELEALALAWTIRNRQLHLTGKREPDAKGGILPAPFGLPDPTRGATHFHRHDEMPPWAATQEPTALIGCYLFYDLRSCDDKSRSGLIFTGHRKP